MASFCRSALMGSRSIATRFKTLNQNPINQLLKPTVSSSTRPTTIATASRVVSIVGCVDSLVPFHSATASARLVSSIAVDSSCWSWLSQGFATPL